MTVTASRSVRTDALADTPVLELLRTIDAKLDRLLARERGYLAQPRSTQPSVVHLMPVLASAVADTAFTASDVIRHAALVSPDLRQALEAAGAATGRKLGKLFRRIEGQNIAGFVLERIGQERDGVVWRLRVSRVS